MVASVELLIRPLEENVEENVGENMIVVTGATGNVGQSLVRILTEAGEAVTAVSRRPPEAGLPPGVRHHRADLTDPASLRSPFGGADALFLLISGDFVEADGSVADVLETAREAGIRRVVMMSSLGVATGSHPPTFETPVAESGLEWTLLRPGGFHSNTFAWAESVRTQRMVAAPFGDVALPTIDPADIAEVAAVTLRENGHAGEAYLLTGPAPISPRQQVAAIADALGEPVRFVEQTREQARTEMLRFMPAEIVENTLNILGTPNAAEQRVSPEVERITGRPARPYAEWAARNAAVFK